MEPPRQLYVPPCPVAKILALSNGSFKLNQRRQMKSGQPRKGHPYNKSTCPTSPRTTAAIKQWTRRISGHLKSISAHVDTIDDPKQPHVTWTSSFDKFVENTTAMTNDSQQPVLVETQVSHRRVQTDEFIGPSQKGIVDNVDHSNSQVEQDQIPTEQSPKIDDNSERPDDYLTATADMTKPVEINEQSRNPVKNADINDDQPPLPSKKKRFSCPIEGCDKTFTQKNNVANHLESKAHRDPNKKKKFSCPIDGCGKTFVQKGNIVDHLQSKDHRHPNAEKFPSKMWTRIRDTKNNEKTS